MRHSLSTVLKYQPPDPTLTLPVSLPPPHIIYSPQHLLATYCIILPIYPACYLLLQAPFRERFLSFIFTATPKIVPGIE